MPENVIREQLPRPKQKAHSLPWLFGNATLFCQLKNKEGREEVAIAFSPPKIFGSCTDPFSSRAATLHRSSECPHGGVSFCWQLGRESLRQLGREKSRSLGGSYPIKKTRGSLVPPQLAAICNDSLLAFVVLLVCRTENLPGERGLRH